MNKSEARLLKARAQRAAARHAITLDALRNARRAEAAARKRDDARRKAALQAQRSRLPAAAEPRAVRLAPEVPRRLVKRVVKRASTSTLAIPARQTRELHLRRGARLAPVPRPLPRGAPLVQSPVRPPKTAARRSVPRSLPRAATVRTPPRLPHRIALPPRDKPVTPVANVRTPARAAPPRPASAAPPPATRPARLPPHRARQVTRVAPPSKAHSLSRASLKPPAPPRIAKGRVPHAVATRTTRATSSRQRAVSRPIVTARARPAAVRVPARPRLTARPTATPARSALPVKPAARAKLPQAPLPDSGLPRLATQGNLVLDASGTPVLLRGVNIAGVDQALMAGALTPADSLGLTAAALEHLATTWQVNVLRLPVSSSTVGDDAALSMLAELVTLANDAGFLHCWRSKPRLNQVQRLRGRMKPFTPHWRCWPRDSVIRRVCCSSPAPRRCRGLKRGRRLRIASSVRCGQRIRRRW